MEENTGIDVVTVIKRGLDAALNYFESTGELRFPFKLTPTGQSPSQSIKGPPIPFPSSSGLMVAETSEPSHDQPLSQVPVDYSQSATGKMQTIKINLTPAQAAKAKKVLAAQKLPED